MEKEDSIGNLRIKLGETVRKQTKCKNIFLKEHKRKQKVIKEQTLKILHKGIKNKEQEKNKKCEISKKV